MAESKNTSGTTRSRGLWAEEKVCASLIQKGHRILARNKKFYRTEVDIYFQSQLGEHGFIEVKSLKDLGYLNTAVGPRQRRRLRRAASAVSDQGIAIKLILATVDPSTGVISWFPHFFD